MHADAGGPSGEGPVEGGRRRSAGPRAGRAPSARASGAPAPDAEALERLLREHVEARRRGEPSDLAARLAQAPGARATLARLLRGGARSASGAAGEASEGAVPAGVAPADAAHARRAAGLAAALRAREASEGLSLPRRRRLGPFQVLARLGQGSMGTVLHVRVVEPTLGLSPGDEAALKVFHPALAEREDLLQRFHREALVGLRVTHPGLARTLGTGEARVGGRRVPYLVMEHAAGEDLARRLARRERLPEAEVRDLGRQVAQALAALAAAQVVHRDLKPSNILCGDDGRVRLLDYGLALLLEPLSALTLSGSFVGAVLYAAPEQLQRRRGAVDERSDLYALGLVLFEALAGEPPWPPEAPGPMLRRREQEPAPDLARRVPGASPFLAAVVGTLLEREPARRFPSAAALAEVLAQGEASAWWRARASTGPGPGPAAPTRP